MPIIWLLFLTFNASKMISFETQLSLARQASYQIALLADEQKKSLLLDMADRLMIRSSDIISANTEDLKHFQPDDALYDRALLSEERIAAIANELRTVAGLPNPVWEMLEERRLANGLHLQKRRVPFGVVGIIYEARPNVTVDAAAICIKSGNAVLLRGSSNCQSSNTVLVAIMRMVLAEHGLDENLVQLLDSDRTLVDRMLNACGLIDVIIPRGGQKLIEHVRANSKVPIIETGAGVVHCYVDEFADVKMASAIVLNSKTQRPSVCNALDTLLLHRNVLPELLADLAPSLLEKRVRIYADASSYTFLKDLYPAELLLEASVEHFGQEFLSLAMSIKTVENISQAIDHIRAHSSGHSEAIISQDQKNQDVFFSAIDAAVVYANASTRFTDGAQFELGAEIGISTQKLHARGPMGLKEMTTYKWIVRGQGQVRG